MKNLLLDSSKSFKSRTDLVLDAFDECTEDGRGELIETIRLLRDQNAGIYLFITSPGNILAASSPNTTPTVKVIAGGGAQTQDLKRYLEGKMARERIKDDERAFIDESIVEKAKGLYHHSHFVAIYFSIDFCSLDCVSIQKPEDKADNCQRIVERIKRSVRSRNGTT